LIYLFFVAAVAVLLLVLAADHVKNRFQHTPRSRRVLRLEAVAAFALGVTAVSYLLHPQSLVWICLWGLLVAVPIFVILAFVTVEVWCRKKQSKYDQQVGQLSREVTRLREEVQRLNWRERDLAQRRGRVEDQRRERLEEQAEIRRQLAHWERGGGLARLRTVKVRDWQEDFEALSTEELEERREELRSRVSESRSEERDQLRAQLNVVELIILGRELGGPDRGETQVDSQLSELRHNRQDIEQELAVMEQELEEWRRRKQQFLVDKIKLD